MINYQTELSYFNNIYLEMQACEKSKVVKNLLYKLLEFNTVEDIATYYNGSKKNSDIVFPHLEEYIITKHPLEELKTRIVACAIDKLLKIKMPD